MTEINLLRGELQNLKKRETTLNLFPWVLGVVLTLLMLTFLGQLGLRMFINYKLARIEKDIARYQEAADIYNQLVQLENQNQKKEERLSKASSSGLPLNEVLTLTPAYTPPGVTHQAWQIQEGVFTIEGKASNYETLAQFIQNMESLSFTQSSWLQRTRQQTPQAEIEFTLQLTLAREGW
ncbi:MAG: PilN domain-containing protein [Bacillota bacterium]|nr:PilN domain-containing protein [Bacillota bacterium]